MSANIEWVESLSFKSGDVKRSFENSVVVVIPIICIGNTIVIVIEWVCSETTVETFQEVIDSVVVVIKVVQIADTIVIVIVTVRFFYEEIIRRHHCFNSSNVIDYSRCNAGICPHNVTERGVDIIVIECCNAVVTTLTCLIH